MISALRLPLCFLALLVSLPCAPAQDKSADPLLDIFSVRSVGPANMGGRIVDVAVVESNPDIIYVAAATGGLWKTTNAGNSWTPVMDGITCSLGAVAVAPSNPDIVWVGGGEANPRNSVTWGDGVFRSTDGGKTWKNMGLADSHHIGRVVIHPKNPDIVYVAVLGHVWGPNKERGLFKTSDAGKSWKHVLDLGEDTGCIDVALDPSEPDILYAAAYAVRRDTFSGGNPAKQLSDKAGLFKSTDGGDKWTRMTEGLPAGPYGRCGIDVYRKDSNIVYAVVQASKTPVTVQGGTANQALNLDAGGVFRSDDKGKTWKHINSLCPRPFYYGQVRIDPNDANRVYVLGVAFHVSSNGGAKFGTLAGNVHPDHHALWINPKKSEHLILGNDGGLYFSQNRGTAWEPIRGFALGQFYAVAVDMRKPYRVYGGLQDNGSWGGPSATKNSLGITLNDWFRVSGGDGFHCQVDPNDPDTVYSEMQYGGLKRVDVKQLTAGGKAAAATKNIKPGGAAKGKAAAARFNWSTPLVLSAHNSSTLYYGGHLLFKSTNRGDTWTKISGDLTGGEEGMTTTGHTLCTIGESPLKAGLLYTGSDTGRLHITRDDGKTWTDLTGKLPTGLKEGWISRVECSHHHEGTAYLAVDRHRSDDRKPYLFKTTDHGETWTSLAKNLPPAGPVYVVRESSRNPKLLFAGTEHGVFISRDSGGQWRRFGEGLPVVPVYDLVIHPRDRDLVIGTHGRSVYVTNISPLEELNDRTLAETAFLFKILPAASYPLRKADKAPSPRSFIAPNPPLAARIAFYLKEETKAPSTIIIADKKGKTLAELKASGRAGLNQVLWDLRAGDKAVAPGDYDVRLRVGEATLSGTLKVEAE